MSPATADSQADAAPSNLAQSGRAHLAALHPRDPDDRVRLGFAFYYQWRLADAEAMFRRLVAEHPDLLAARVGLVLCAVSRGDADEARARVQDAFANGAENLAMLYRLPEPEHPPAADDWKEGLRAAVMVLQRPDADPTDRFEAAKLLLEYGVPDAVLRALAGMDVGTAWVRRLRQSAAQLDRLGLGQSAPNLGQGDDAEREQLNALKGAVERLVDGAETLVLVFCGRLDRTWLSIDIMHRILRTTGASLVYLRDFERTRYLGGVVGVGDDFSATVTALSELRARSGARRVVAIGHCVGCAGALRYGLALGVEAVLGVLPRVGAPYLRELSAQGRAKLAALPAADLTYAQDVASLYAAAASPPRVTLIGGVDVEPDEIIAQQLSRRIPGVVYAEMPGAFSESFSELFGSGSLGPVLTSFVAKGGLTQALLDRIAVPRSPGVSRT
jgi:hypothetical protein